MKTALLNDNIRSGPKDPGHTLDLRHDGGAQCIDVTDLNEGDDIVGTGHGMRQLYP